MSVFAQDVFWQEHWRFGFGCFSDWWHVLQLVFVIRFNQQPPSLEITFHNVPIETTAPTEATRFTPKIQDLAQQLSITLRAAMASGEINDTWRMLEDMSFRDAIQTLQAETNLPSE